MHLFTNWTDSSTFFLAPPLPKENIKKPLKKVNSSKREEKKGNQPKTLSTIYIGLRRKEKKKRERKRNRVNKSSSPPDHLDTLVAISGYEKKKKKKNLTYNFARLLGGKLS